MRKTILISIVLILILATLVVTLSACQASPTTPTSNSVTISVPALTTSTPGPAPSETAPASSNPIVTTLIPPAAPPTISIQGLLDGSIVTDSNVTITVAVSGFKLVSPIGAQNVPGEGHINYFLDVEAPVTPNLPAITAPSTFASSSSTSYQWSNLPDAVHTFSAELVNNDNTPLNPPLVVKVSVTVFTG